jgi:hypothetical protein
MASFALAITVLVTILGVRSPNGTTRYEMRSLTGDRQPPDPSLFLPPPRK